MVEQKKIKIEDKKEHFASLDVKNLTMSTKQTIEIANFIRNKNLKKVRTLLDQVLKKKIAVPFKRFNRDMGHKPGKICSGRYPLKVTEQILKLLNSVEANAEDKGLNVENLKIEEIIVNKAANQWHAGRLRRRRMKRTNIKLKVVEIEK